MDNRKRDSGWWTSLMVGVAYVMSSILIAILVGAAVEPAGDALTPPISVNVLAQAVKDARVKSVEMTGNRGVATTVLDKHYSFRLSNGTDLLEVLAAYGVTGDEMTKVEYVVKDSPLIASLFGALSNVLPMLFLAGFVFVLMRRPARDTNEQILDFARSRARRFSYERTITRFEDVAGADEAKQEVQEIVEFLRHPQKFAALGARLPKGVLFLGAPGMGKTLLSRAVAGEAWVPFYNIAGSEFVEMIAGVGASRVRNLFEEARRNAPCIVFIDEIDAVGRRRGVGLGGSGSDEHDQTLNQILVEMDGFDCNSGVIVIAATNRPDILDPALLRPGRFDRQVLLRAPDCKGRKAILEVHARGKPLAESVDLSVLAKVTPGFSGADLANLINEGAILAARRNHQAIGMRELEEGIDRVIAGPECKSRVMSQREKELTAYHESGHAVVMRYIPLHDPIQKITIVPRGRLGAYTRCLPPEDRAYITRSQFKAMLASALGGHTAEQLVFADITTGAENDIEQATSLARRMITEYGMSERLGRVAFSPKDDRVFLRHQISEQRSYSEKTAEAIDDEIRRLLDEARAEAVHIIEAHRELLDRLARALLQVETLDGANLERVFRGEPLLDPAATSDIDAGADAASSGDVCGSPHTVQSGSGLLAEHSD